MKFIFILFINFIFIRPFAFASWEEAKQGDQAKFNTDFYRIATVSAVPSFILLYGIATWDWGKLNS